MSKIIIVLNGPPGCGKDSLASHLQRVLDVEHCRFKTALYEDTAEFFDVDLDVVIELATNRLTKEVPTPVFGGLSPRQALIHVSEDVMKPRHGENYYGWRLVEEIRGIPSHEFVVSDGGFPAEIRPVLAEFGLDSVLVARIHRPGCDFSSDSRDYLTEASIGRAVNFVDVHNDATTEKYLQQATEFIDNFIEQRLN